MILSLHQAGIATTPTQIKHLKFEGKILNDGSYVSIVTEVLPVVPAEEGKYRNTLTMPLVHTFHFSENCDFNEYQVKQQAIYFKETGFFVSANSQCLFDESRKSPGDGLTAYILEKNKEEEASLVTRFGDAILDIVPANYMILTNPVYYRELCYLAQKNNEVIAL